jgi:hypothetical protein
MLYPPPYIAPLNTPSERGPAPPREGRRPTQVRYMVPPPPDVISLALQAATLSEKIAVNYDAFTPPRFINTADGLPLPSTTSLLLEANAGQAQPTAQQAVLYETLMRRRTPLTMRRFERHWLASGATGESSSPTIDCFLSAECRASAKSDKWGQETLVTRGLPAAMPALRRAK